MHPGQWDEQRTTTACAALISYPEAAAMKNPRNICFFCRICTSPKPIPHIPADIKVIPVEAGRQRPPVAMIDDRDRRRGGRYIDWVLPGYAAPRDPQPIGR
jgi:hypothetical protein